MVQHVDPEQLALRALGERLDDADERNLTRHLDTCPACRAELDSLSATVALGREVPRSELSGAMDAPPPRVWESVKAELGLDDRPQVSVAAVPEAAAEPPRAFRPGRWAAAAAAALVAVVGIGLAAWRPWAGPTEVTSVVLEPLEPGARSRGEARIVQDGQRRELQVEASGLPLRTGYHEVWLLEPGSGRMLSLGVLDTGEPTRLPLPAGLPLEAFPVVDVSEEAFDGEPAHSGRSVLRGTLTS